MSSHSYALPAGSKKARWPVGRGLAWTASRRPAQCEAETDQAGLLRPLDWVLIIEPQQQERIKKLAPRTGIHPSRTIPISLKGINDSSYRSCYYAENATPSRGPALQRFRPTN